MSDTVNPSRSSYYVSNDYYAGLIEAFADWRHDDWEITDPELRDELRRVIAREARILDENRFEDWLAIYAGECTYWVPGTAGGGDPRREIAIAFDDRRRLEDRVYRLGTGIAWSQAPASRTVRLVSNLEAYLTDDQAIVMLRSNFVISEFRAGETRIWSGWTGHRLRRRDEGWEVLVKQVNLIDHDQNIRNPSIIL